MNDLPEAPAISGTVDAPVEPASPAARRPIPPLAALLTLTFLGGLALGFVLWGGEPAPASPASPIEARVPVSVDDDPALGPADAPVTMIEFSDFTCPYCRKFNQETFPALWQAYPDQIRFVYRDYPI
ncbi:MAG: thioredoxin domain-containing protein, partial [Anaerolineales bacterium]